MQVSRKVLLVGAFAMAGAAVLAIWILKPAIERRLVGVHQRSVTRSLAKWAQEDCNITNQASAIHGAEMVGYVSSYYVPGEGYRGPADGEAALEIQRQRTIGQIVASLERYTGLPYGTNVERWTEWARGHKGSEEHATNSQPASDNTH